MRLAGLFTLKGTAMQIIECVLWVLFVLGVVAIAAACLPSPDVAKVMDEHDGHAEQHKPDPLDL